MALPAGRYGVTKNQLLKIKKLPMNTIKLIEELTEKFDLLGTAAFKNSTSVVTESSDLVESGAVKDIVGWGNKNLLLNIATSQTVSNVSFTVNADKSITVSGNNSTNIYAGVIVGEKSVSYGDVFVASCGSDALTSNTVRAQIDFYNGSTFVSSTQVLNDDTNITVPQNITKIVYRIYVAPNYTIPSPITIYPMLRKPGTPSSYELYHETVQEMFNSLGESAYKDSISVVTESSDLVESGAVKDIVGWGNKNLLNVEEYTFKSSAITANLDNATGKIYLSSTGGASGVNYNTAFTNVSGKVKISFDLISSTADTTNCVIGTRRISNNQFAESYTSDELTVGHHEKEFTVSNELYLSILVNTNNNTGEGYLNLDNFMISKDGGAYEPYHASVEETKADNSVIGTVEGENASKAWSVGEHFIKDGAFKEVTQPIASGGAISDSNTVDKPIAEILTELKIKSATFSGTTDADGNLAIIDDTNSILLSAECNGRLAFVFKSSTKSFVKIVTDNLTALANTSVSGTYYYI